MVRTHNDPPAHDSIWQDGITQPGIMDYTRELNKMKKHHRLYHPAMARMMELYREMKHTDPSAEISDFDEMIIILELIDIGYLDEDAFIVTRRFNDITGLMYNGRYPFTEAGENIFRTEGHVKIRESILRFIGGLKKR